MDQQKISGNEAPLQQDLPERVLQPQKLEQFSELREYTEAAINLVGNISEKIEKHHEQFAGPQAGSSQDDTEPTEREKLLAELPTVPLMQRKLEKHIDKEIRGLRKQARSVASSRKIGWAYELNQIFAQIRHLSAMLRQMLHASADAIRKYYIAVFIDRQDLGRQSHRSVQPV